MEINNKQTVLLTGATGFVGSHLLKALKRKKVNIIVLVRSEDQIHLFSDSNVIPVVASLLDSKKIDSIFNKFHPEILYHLAAQSLVEEGHDDPRDTFNSNVRGSWNILEAARRSQVRRCIVASTAHVYGENKKVPYKESYYPQPSRPYETSKACVDLIAQSYADTYGMAIEIPRFTNIYGPGDRNLNRIVPKVMVALVQKKQPILWDIGAKRDFIYINDAIDAYIRLGWHAYSQSGRSRVINIGSGNPTNITDLVRAIYSVSNMHFTSDVFQKVPSERSKEIKHQYVVIAKAKRLLDWQPTTSIHGGLRNTYLWYKHTYAHEK